MKKKLYSAPETWTVPICMESVLCQSGPASSGEDMNPFTGDAFDSISLLPTFDLL